ncbi:MAG: glycosyltransferase involved in cell wall biosynthesis, partial [Planctomycetota bacterium]
DAEFNALWLDRVSIASLDDANTMTERFRIPDREGLIGLGLKGSELEEAVKRAEERRNATFQGLFEGSHAERREQIPGILTEHRLRVLFVVHSFPPETRAGTEVYTLHLAQALQERGHEVTVLARAELKPDDAGGAQPYIEEGRFEGLRVLRLRRALDHGSLRATWDDTRVEALFDQLLDAQSFDIVHFQHLIHLSVTLIERARTHGCATIAHLHDYWALCARVQLIRPDRNLCENNMGLGCLACVKEKRLEQVPSLSRSGRFLGPPARALAGLLGASKPGRRSRRGFLRGLMADFSDMDERGGQILGALGQADLVVSPSRFLREKYLVSGHFHPHRLVYSPNGLRVDGLPTEKRTGGAALRVGFVGSLLWYKGLDVLIDAVRALGPDATQLELHVHGPFSPGKDAYHAELAERAEGLPVEFHGSFGDEERSAVYAGLDVLVVPSLWYENSPVTMHEAWFTRTALVASRLGGMAELISDGVDGLLFEPGDANALAACLRSLGEDREQLRSLASAAPPLKTITEDAADHEFRYRGLVARLRRS